MHKLYQEQWHGIPFSSFADISAEDIAGPDFYARFYEEFFNRHKTWGDLSPEWLAFKRGTAEFIRERAGDNRSLSMFSVGCGLGIIEKFLSENGYKNLEANEVSDIPLKFIKRDLPEMRIFVGPLPGCLPPGRGYDFIYMAASEYFFDQKQLSVFLGSLRAMLSPGGKLLLISVSVEGGETLRESLSALKSRILAMLRLRPRGQFWGYLRTPTEFMDAMARGGFTNLSGGLRRIGTHNRIYWVEGQ